MIGYYVNVNEWSPEQVADWMRGINYYFIIRIFNVLIIYLFPLKVWMTLFFLIYSLSWKKKLMDIVSYQQLWRTFQCF